MNLRKVALLLATGAILVGCGDDAGSEAGATDELTIDPPRCEQVDDDGTSTLVDLDTRKAWPAQGGGPPYKWELAYGGCGRSYVSASGGTDQVGAVDEIGAANRDECMSATQTDTRVEFEMDEVLHQRVCLITSEGNLVFIEFAKLSATHNSGDATGPTPVNGGPTVTLRYRNYGPA